MRLLRIRELSPDEALVQEVFGKGGRGRELSDAEWIALARFAARASMLPLLARRLKETGAWRKCPERVQQAAERAAVAEAARSELRRLEASRILEGFDRERVPALVLKGAALAHTVYPLAALRPSCDVDLLVAESERERAGTVLEALGYDLVREFGWETSYERRDAAGWSQKVDLHWGGSDVGYETATIRFEEMYERSVPVPALGASARTLGRADALVLACLHLTRHASFEERWWERLIWFYDAHLLAGGLEAAELSAFVGLASEKRAAAVCRAVLVRASALFGTRLPGPQMASLRASALLRAGREPSSVFLLVGHDVLRRNVHNALQADWGRRVRLARRLVVPDAAAMRDRYGSFPAAVLPALHARRWAECLWRHVLRPSPPTPARRDD